MDIPFLHLNFSFDLLAPVADPYLLFRMRRMFPAAFRQTTGCSRDTGACAVGDDCPCCQTFSQALATDPAALRRYQKPPLPFAFRLPLIRTGGSGEMELELVIVGNGVRFAERYIASLLRLCGHGLPFPLRLTEVSALAADGSRHRLGNVAGTLTLSAMPLRTFAEVEGLPLSGNRALSLSLQTPLRLVGNGRPVLTPDFPLLAGALFRRVSSLAYYYGGIELPHDFKWLATRSRAVGCRGALEAVNWGGALQGGIGTLVFSGELEEFLPFVRLGELLNVGKGAAYGMGQYCLGRQAVAGR